MVEKTVEYAVEGIVDGQFPFCRLWSYSTAAFLFDGLFPLREWDNLTVIIRFRDSWTYL